MKIRPVVLATLSLIFCLSAVDSLAQDPKSSERAAINFIEKRQKDTGNGIDANQLIVGFGVSRYQTIGVSLDLSIFVGESLVSLPPLEFVAQPLASKTDDKGNSSLVEVGSRATIKSPRSESLARNASGSVANREIITRIPENASAVRILVKGLSSTDQEFSVVLPIRDVPSTAVIARSLACSQNNLIDCQWFTGSCDGLCQGTLCVACNNASPSLNCVTCTMGCGGGGSGSNCTPSSPAPQGCPEN